MRELRFIAASPSHARKPIVVAGAPTRARPPLSHHATRGATLKVESRPVSPFHPGICEILTEMTEAGTRRMVDRLLALTPTPTALYCFNNTRASSAVMELHRRVTFRKTSASWGRRRGHSRRDLLTARLVSDGLDVRGKEIRAVLV